MERRWGDGGGGGGGGAESAPPPENTYKKSPVKIELHCVDDLTMRQR